jgi:hypothetical protein
MELCVVELFDRWGRSFYRCSGCCAAFVGKQHTCGSRSTRSVNADVVTTVYSCCRAFLAQRGIHSVEVLRKHLSQSHLHSSVAALAVEGCLSIVSSSLSATPTVAGCGALQYSSKGHVLDLKTAIKFVLGIDTPARCSVYSLFQAGEAAAGSSAIIC